MAQLDKIQVPSEVIMPSAVEIIRDAESLPVEERTLIVDTLLRFPSFPARCTSVCAGDLEAHRHGAHRHLLVVCQYCQRGLN